MLCSGLYTTTLRAGFYNAAMSSFWAVVMAGGSGTRFWPMSRATAPKQLLPLLGPVSMIRQTVERLFPLFDPSRVLVVCGRAHADAIRHELPTLPPEHVIDEPVGRDTAAAVGLAATVLEARDPGATWAMLAADHHVAPVDRFHASLKAAYDAAQSGALVTFGVKPRHPATGYGYLERGERDGAAWKVARFCEKPDLARAKEFVASGRHFWNSGMFVWRSRAVLAEIERLLPDHARELATIRGALGTPAVLAECYPRMPKISIDFGVMEKATRVVMVEADFEWDDVGSWRSVAAYRPKDADGNATEGTVATVDTKDAVVVSTEAGHLVATLGLSDVVVVHTKDATLVCPKSRSEDLKKLVDALRAKGLERYL
jgi:mannose-1-phosphate guanylyltransferase